NEALHLGQIAKSTDGVHRQHGGTETAAFIDFWDQHLTSEDVGQHLPPVRRAGEASSSSNLLGFSRKFMEGAVDGVEVEENALEAGADHVRRCVMEAEPDEGAARFGIPIGGALTGEKWQTEQALRADGYCRCDLDHHLIRVEAALHCLLDFNAAAFISQPAQ